MQLNPDINSIKQSMNLSEMERQIEEITNLEQPATNPVSSIEIIGMRHKPDSKIKIDITGNEQATINRKKLTPKKRKIQINPTEKPFEKSIK